MFSVLHYRWALVAGICFIAVCILYSALAISAKTTYLVEDLNRLEMIFLMIVWLYCATLAVHILGYVDLGTSSNDTWLRVSGITTLVGILFLAVLTTFLAFDFDSRTIAKLGITVFYLSTIPFALSILRMFNQFGAQTILAACLVPIAGKLAMSMWDWSWIAVFPMLASLHILYKASSARSL